MQPQRASSYYMYMIVAYVFQSYALILESARHSLGKRRMQTILAAPRLFYIAQTIVRMLDCLARLHYSDELHSIIAGRLSIASRMTPSTWKRFRLQALTPVLPPVDGCARR